MNGFQNYQKGGNHSNFSSPPQKQVPRETDQRVRNVKGLARNGKKRRARLHSKGRLRDKTGNVSSGNLRKKRSTVKGENNNYFRWVGYNSCTREGGWIRRITIPQKVHISSFHGIMARGLGKPSRGRKKFHGQCAETTTLRGGARSLPVGEGQLHQSGLEGKCHKGIDQPGSLGWAKLL